MPIASERQSSVNAGLMAGAVPETIAAPKPVSDFMEAFRTGFITVDDINKRVRQNVAETDQLKTSLAAGDLQRKQIGQAAELSPVNFELTKGKMEADRIKQQLEAAKLNEALVMQTGTPEEQKALMEKTQQLTDQAEYIKNYGRLPDTFTLPQQPLPPFEEWVKDSDYNDTLQAIEEAGGTDTSSLNQVKDGTGQPFELQPSQEQLARRATMKAQTLNEAKAVYDQLNAERRKGETVKRGTPEYYKALRDKLESFRSKQAEREVMLKAAPNILETEAEQRAKAPERAKAVEKEKASALQTTLQKDKVFEAARDGAEYFRMAEKLATDPNTKDNPMAQKALVYSVVKAWDPGTAVKEGETKMMMGNAGLGNTIQRFVGNLDSGMVLTPEQLKQVADMARSMASMQKGVYDSRLADYRKMASESGISDESFKLMMPPPRGYAIGDDIKTLFPKSTEVPAPTQPQAQSTAPAAPTPAKVLTKNAQNVDIVEGKIYRDQKSGNQFRAMSNPDGTIRWEPVR